MFDSNVCINCLYDVFTYIDVESNV